MNFDPQNLLWLFIFVLISYAILHVGRIGIGQWLRWDTGERERVLQQKLADLQRELDKAKERVIILEKQIELLLGQYNDAIVRLNSFKTQYEAALEDAKHLKEELDDVRRDMPRRDNDVSRRRLLIAAIGGKEKDLTLDLASLRAVQMETGLEFERILEATPEKLKKTLDRSRMNRNLTYLHMAVLSGKEGYMLGGEVVEAEWLSEVLGGVLVLLVTGSESDWVGDFLGVVPYVVTMSDQVNSRDATQFSRIFWSEIGRGMGPIKALETALDRAPSVMREYVVRHWS